MLLRELFEPPTNVTFNWEERVSAKQTVYRDKVVLGQDRIDIIFYVREAGVYLVEFSVNDSFNITGEGNASQIFGIIIAGIRDFIAKHKPLYLVFDAREPSRVKLYERIVTRLIRNSGYRTIKKRSLPREYLRNNGADLFHTPFVLKRVSKD